MARKGKRLGRGCETFYNKNLPLAASLQQSLHIHPQLLNIDLQKSPASTSEACRLIIYQKSSTSKIFSVG